MNVDYLVATPKNSEQIAELEEELFSFNKFNLNQIKEELTNVDRYYVVAKLNNNIVGYAGISLNVDFAEVIKIAVDSDYQKLGIATAMFNKLLSFCKENGFFKMILEVSHNNSPAINFYKKLGFNKIHIRKNYYSDRSDALIYELLV